MEEVTKDLFSGTGGPIVHIKYENYLGKDSWHIVCCRQKDLWVSSFTSHSYVRIPPSAWTVNNGNL